MFTLKKPSKKIITLLICAFGIIGFVVWDKLENKSQYLQSNQVRTDTTSENTNNDSFADLDILNTMDTGIATDTTISEAVSQNLYTNTFNMSENDTATPDNVNALVDNLVNGVQNTFVYKEYNKDSLPIIKEQNKDSVRLYASRLATLQMNLLTNISESQDAIDKDNTVLSDIYAKQAADIFAISTPKELVDTEIQIINNFSKVAAAFTVLSKQKEDPLKLPLAVKAYQEAATEQDGLFKSIGEYLNKNDIINSLDGDAQKYWAFSITQ